MTLQPAYGRDYKSAKEVKAAWAEGKDFVVADLFSGRAGAKINKNDAPKGETLSIRYKKDTQVVLIKN